MGFRCLVALCLCFYHLFLNDLMAQVTPHFLEKLTTAEGLSSNKINDIVQDDDGFLWIATNDGLNRFDGTEIKQYYHRDSVNSVPHNFVYCLKKLPGNYIAIGTQAGLSFYNRGLGVFQNFYYTQNNALDEFNNSIVKLELDAKGNLWAASRNCIFIFDPGLKLKKIISSPFTAADAARQRLRFTEKISPLSNGNMLLYLRDGWHIYSPATERSVKLSNSAFQKQLEFLDEMAAWRLVKKNDQYFPAANVFKIFGQYFICIKPGADSLSLFDEKGVPVSSCFFPYNKYPYISWSQQLVMIDSSRLLFLFHNYGLVEMNISWQNNRPLIAGLSGALFEDHKYRTALRDQQGNWWLATTENGLRKISPYKQYFKSYPLIDDDTGKPVKYEMSSANRYQNTLWIATYGEGFFGRDLLSGKQQHYRLNTKANDPWPNFIWNVRQTSSDSLWLGTQAGMFWYRISNKTQGRLPAYPGKPAVLDSMPVTTQFVDSRGLVWMGLGRGNGLCYFDSKNRRFNYFPANSSKAYPLRYPTQIAEDNPSFAV